MDLYWAQFLRHVAGAAKEGSIRALEGVEAAWMNAAFFINNGAYLTSPVTDPADFAARLTTARADADQTGLPWAFYAYEPYLGALGGGDAEVAAQAGFQAMMGIRVMTGAVDALRDPVRPAPSDLEFERVLSEAQQAELFGMNLLAYGMPLDLTPAVMEAQGYFQNPAREFGYLARVNGVPVSTATVIELEGLLYVALVATAADQRRKGYAEAVMRHALEQAMAATGVTRSALDATDAGAPIYERMGYEFTGSRWTVYAPTPS
jgi:ribosomal protein S18 acetylase RimI-like enzyme